MSAGSAGGKVVLVHGGFVDGSGWQAVYNILTKDGFLFLDREKFHSSFAGDLPTDLAAFMADSQVPWGVDALGGTISEPAWRTKQAGTWSRPRTG